MKKILYINVPQLAFLATVLIFSFSFYACGGDDDDDQTTDDAGTANDGGGTTEDGGGSDECTGCVEVEVSTTLTKRIEYSHAIDAEPSARNPAIRKYGDQYLKDGYGDYTVIDGEEHTLRDDLVTDYTPPTDESKRKSLMIFVQTTDVHITDDEAPTRVAALDNSSIEGGLRPQDYYSSVVFDAFLRTLKPLYENMPLAFLFITGDVIDSTLNTEFTYFLDSITGKTVNADSGEDNDIVKGESNDPKDPFQAIGLDIPWYFVLGNHDLLVVGNTAPTEETNAKAIGDNAATGTRDWRKNGDVVRGEVPADKNRYLLSREAIVEKLLQDDALGSGPKGHGYYQDNIDSQLYHSKFEPIDGLPLVVLTLDGIDPNGGANGFLDRARDIEGFLVPEIEAAQENDKLVIVASHFPSGSIDSTAGNLGDPVEGAIEGDELVSVLNQYPNVIMYVAGHTHENRVFAHSAPEGKGGEYGYWEVVTSSLLNYPMQARLFELVDNEDGTLSIFTTLLDYAAPEGSLAEMARRLAMIDLTSGWTPAYSDMPLDRNTELIVKLTPEMQTAISNFKGNDKIESLNGLKEVYKTKMSYPGL